MHPSHFFLIFFQVKSFVSKVENSSSSNSSRYSKVIGAKPFKRPSLSQMTTTATVTAPTSLPATASLAKADILAASRRPSAVTNGTTEPPAAAAAVITPSEANGDVAKPQFYFGQELTNGHGENSLQTASKTASKNSLQTASKQSAIDKVKMNEAVSHPKNILINPGYKIKDYVDPAEKSGKPSFAFGEPPIVRKTSAASNTVEMAKSSNRPASVSPAKQQQSRSPEPMIEPLVRNYSKFATEASSGSAAAPSSTVSEFRVPRPNLKPTLTKKKAIQIVAERAAFEAEVATGRSRLKKVNGSVGLDDADSASPSLQSMPPPPPPLMHFNTSSVTTPSGSVISPAPRLPLPPIPSSSSSRSGMAKPASGFQTAARKAMFSNPRDELMSAIRGRAGGNGLRKVLCDVRQIERKGLLTNQSFLFRRREKISRLLRAERLFLDKFWSKNKTKKQ
jgi:hypothetical protein